MKNVTIITGGGSGVGMALARQMASLESCMVFAIDRNAEGLAALSAQVEQDGGEVWTHVADLTDPQQVEAAFKAADALGPLGALVTAAGLGVKTLSNTPREYWDTVIKVNLIAVMDCCNQAALRMARSHGGSGGRVVTVGSLCVRAHDNDCALYASTKGGVELFTNTWRRELEGEGIDVTLFHPGGIATPMDIRSQGEKDALIAADKLMLPADVADAIVYCLTRRPGIVIPEMFAMASGQQFLM